MAIAVVFLLLIAYQLYASHLAAHAAAVTNAKNLSLTLESGLNTDLTAAARTVSEMVNEIDPKAMRQEVVGQHRPKIVHWLKSQVRDIASASALRYIDAAGERLYSSIDGEPPVNISDRTHFRQLKDDPSSTLIFSEVMKGRTAGRVSLYVAKPILNENGSFLGIASATIDLTSIQELLRHIDLGREGVVALRRLDNGALVVRFPGAVEIDNTPAPDLPVRLAILKDGPTGAIEITSPVDGKKRIYGYRAIGAQPFFVAVGIADNDYLAEWRRNSALLLLGSLFFLGTLSGVFYLLTTAESHRKASEIRLREVLREQQTMLDNNLVGIIKVRNRRVVWANSAFERMLGYERGELVGMETRTGFPSEEAYLALGTVAYSALAAGNEFRTEAEYVRKDGKRRWADVSGSMLGQADGEALWVLVDITDRKLSENARVASERRLDLASTAGAVGVWDLDPVSGVAWGSVLHHRIFGYASNEVPWGFEQFLSHVVPEDRAMVNQQVEDARSTGKLHFECRIVRTDQAERWIEAKGEALGDAQSNSLRLMGTVMDITERKKEEELLRLQEEIIRNMKEGVCLSQASSGTIIFANQLFECMFGYATGELNGKHVSLLNAPSEISPLELANGIIDALNQNGVWAGDIRNIRKDGTTFWSHATVSTMRHREHGTVWVAVHQDVTERKLMQEQMQQLLFEQNAILDSRIVGIVKLKQRKMLWVNDAYAQMLGYTKEEMIGMPTRTVYPSDEAYDNFARTAYPVMQRGETFRTEIQYLRKDGRLGWYNISGGLVFPGSEESIWAFVDVTEKKQAEEQVRQLAFHDALTQLPNRRLLNDRLTQNLAASKRSGYFGAAIFLDLDNFKPLNDAHGHEVGDLLLLEVADRLKYCIREMDTVARFGGDEFVVVLSHLARDKVESTSQARVVAEKIQTTLAVPYRLIVKRDGKADTSIEHRCTASIGVALFANNEGNQDDVLKWADMAMYQAKQAGPSLIRFHEPNA